MKIHQTSEMFFTTLLTGNEAVSIGPNGYQQQLFIPSEFWRNEEYSIKSKEQTDG